MSKIVSPKNEEIGRIVGELIGKKVTVTAADGPGEPTHAGIFLFRDDTVGLVARGDIRAVAYTGSALTMIPKGAADDAIAEGEVTGMQVECFQEVLNVVSQAWNLAGSQHIRLVKTVPVGDLAPEHQALVDGGTVQHHVTIDVAGYGPGTLTFSGNG